MTKHETLSQVNQTADALLHANEQVEKFRMMTADSLPADHLKLRYINQQLRSAEDAAKRIVTSANIIIDIIEGTEPERKQMTHTSDLATMAESVANSISRTASAGVDAEASEATVTITDSYQHRRYTLTVEGVELWAETWAVVSVISGIADEVYLFTDDTEAEAKRDEMDKMIHTDAYIIAVDLPQATPRRYEVAGFERSSIEALIGPEKATDADLEAIADKMGHLYLSSDDFATDLRQAVREVLPNAEHI